MAVAYLEAEDSEWGIERALRELAASDVPFDSWFGTHMRRLFGCDFPGSPSVAAGELLFAWRADSDGGEQEISEGS